MMRRLGGLGCTLLALNCTVGGAGGQWRLFTQKGTASWISVRGFAQVKPAQI